MPLDNTLIGAPAYKTFFDEYGPEEPLKVPFDVALVPPNFHGLDAPGQEIAMASALMAPDTERDAGEAFFNERIRMIALSKLK
jgi:hypothetical protein